MTEPLPADTDPDLLKQQLLTVLQPIAVAADSTLRQLVETGTPLPVGPRPELSFAEGRVSGASLGESLDADTLARMTIDRLQGSSQLFAAKRALAQFLGVELQGEGDADEETAWNPEGQLLLGFLTAVFEAGDEEDHDPLPPAWAQLVDPAVATAVEDLAEFLSQPQFGATALAPLTGVVGDLANYDLDDSVRIVRLSQTALREIWAGHGWGSRALSPLQVHEIFVWTHAIEVSATSEKLKSPDWAAAQDAIDRALLALRLAAPGAAAVRRTWLRFEPRMRPFAERLVGGAGVVERPTPVPIGAGHLQLTSDVLERARRLWRWLAEPDRERRASLALRRFEAGYRRADLEDQILDHWIAFEALFLDNNAELKYRASLRIARYVGDTHAERVMLFKGLQRSYDLRSAIIHGEDSAAKAKPPFHSLADAAAFSGETLRQVLVRWLDPSVPNELAELDEKLLR